MEVKTPWTKFYGKVPKHIDYPEFTLSEMVLNVAKLCPKDTALVYMGKNLSYKQLECEILRTQQMLLNIGVRKGDRVAVCLPNIPQAVYLLYALDRMGAVAAFVHPLSAPLEIVRYLKELDAVCVIALDSMCSVFNEVASHINLQKVIFTSPADELGELKRIIYSLRTKKKSAPRCQQVKEWRKLKSKCNSTEVQKADVKADDTSVVLFSGGTTGEPKGVMLSGRALNAMAMQTALMSGTEVSKKAMLSAMPVFHGFGLCVCIHTILSHAGTCVLVPRFTVEEYAKLIKKHRPAFIAGVPTLFEALTREKAMKNVDLSCLEGVFCGGDTLPLSLKKKVDLFLREHNAQVRIREGYGATECVTASCLTPCDFEKEGSIGIPFPDTYYKICKEGTDTECKTGEVGEICISGPAVMKGYLGDVKETEKVLKKHSDGRIWLHTQDAGKMDEDGFVYFSHRLKRVIISSGYNIYPQVIERILDAHPKVERCCVAGVFDEYRMQRVKAFVVPDSKVQDEDALREELKVYLKNHVAKYAMPSIIEFTKELPVNAVGKIKYSKLK